MLDENFNLTIWKDYPAFISSIFFSIVHSFFYFQGGSNKVVIVMVLTELLDSDYEKSGRGTTREWIKRRRETYFRS